MHALPTTPPGQIIFVTGASRSGTTLMSQVLGRHSQIAGLYETHFFGSYWSPSGSDRTLSAAEAGLAVTTLLERQRKGRTESRKRPEAAEIASVLDALPVTPNSADVFAATVRFLAARAGKRIPCEQTPRNIYYAQALLERFPEARFIHLLRDPRAVMASQKSRWRKRTLLADPTRMTRTHQARIWFNYHPYTVARLWNRATADALQLQNHPRFRTLKFESLIASPEPVIRELCAFLELDFQPEMLNVEHTNSSYVPSTGRRAGFGKVAIDSWREVLTIDDIGVISDRCAELLARAGYEAEQTNLTSWTRCRLNMGYIVHLAGALALNPRRLLIQARATLRPYQSVDSRPQDPLDDAIHDANEAGEASAPPHASSKRVFGLACMDTPLDVAADHLVACAQSNRRSRVAFINAHCLNVSVDDSELQRALRSADILFADGVGMLLASRMHGQGLRHNVNGTDLFPHLCDRASAAGVAMALLGGAPGVADTCAKVLQRTNPELRIAYRHDGFFEPEEETEILAAINASGAKILLVAMGVPRQEQWIRDHGDRLQVPVVIGVGALFDFVSGGVPRAPLIFRALKSEWVFRLIIEPRRLFTRYVVGNPLFLMRASRYAVTGRLWREQEPT